MQFTISKYNPKNGQSENKYLHCDTHRDAIDKVDEMNKKIKDDRPKWRISVINC